MFSGKDIAAIVVVVLLLAGNAWQYVRTGSLNDENEVLAAALASPSGEEEALRQQVDDLTRQLREEQDERTRQAQRAESLDQRSRELGARITALEDQLEAQRASPGGGGSASRTDATAAPGTRTQPASSGGRDIEYVIKSGDLLQDLARTYYGDSTQWQRILDANRGVVRSARALRPGMKLVIPNVTRE